MIRRTFLKMVLASPLAGLVKKDKARAEIDKPNCMDAGTAFAYRTGYDGVFIIVIGRRFPQGVECTHFTIEDFRPLGRCGFYEWNNLFQDWDEMELWAKFRVRNYIEEAILL